MSWRSGYLRLKICSIQVCNMIKTHNWKGVSLMVVADNVLNFTKRFEDFIWSSTTNASPFSPLVAWKFTKSVRDKTYIDTLLRRWWRYILFYLSFSIRKSPEYPVDTQSRFNVYKTSIRRRRHCIDVLQMLKRRSVSTGWL